MTISPYDTAQTALTDAIIFANDAGGPNGLAGNVLNITTNPAVLPALQERYRYLQQRLISSGVDTFTQEAVVFALPPTASSNPRVRMILSYNGYWNGQEQIGPQLTYPTWSNAVAYTAGQTVTYSGAYYVALQASTGQTPSAPSSIYWQQFSNTPLSAPAWSDATTYTQGMTVTFNGSFWVSQPNGTANLDIEPGTNPFFWVPYTAIGPCLPTNLIKPLELWEAQTGTRAWVPMRQCPDAIQANIIQPRFGQWVFATDRLVLPGASYTNDLRIKYIAVAPDIADVNTVIYPRGVSTALALLLLDQLAGARGGPMAVTFKARAEEAISQLINQVSRKQAYSTFIRRAFNSRSGGAFRGRSGSGV